MSQGNEKKRKIKKMGAKQSNIIDRFLFQPPKIEDLTKVFEIHEYCGMGCIGFNGSGQHWFTSPFDETKIENIHIFFHGNATNIINISNFIYQLAKSLNETVIAVEYPGYIPSLIDESDGSMNQRFESYHSDVIVSKLSSFVQNLAEELGHNKSLVLWGQSIGAGIVMRIVNDLNQYSIIRAVVLISPFTSVKKIASELFSPIVSNLFVWYERFPNLELAKSCTLPIMIIHGTKDDLVPCQHGIDVFNNATQSEFRSLLVVADRGHNDIVISDFLSMVQKWLKCF